VLIVYTCVKIGWVSLGFCVKVSTQMCEHVKLT